MLFLFRKLNSLISMLLHHLYIIFIIFTFSDKIIQALCTLRLLQWCCLINILTQSTTYIYVYVYWVKCVKIYFARLVSYFDRIRNQINGRFFGREWGIYFHLRIKKNSLLLRAQKFFSKNIFNTQEIFIAMKSILPWQTLS